MKLSILFFSDYVILDSVGIKAIYIQHMCSDLLFPARDVQFCDMMSKLCEI